METNQNDSPRQPVWQIKLGDLSVKLSPAGVDISANYAPRRCICGAKPTAAGDLPCGH